MTNIWWWEKREFLCTGGFHSQAQFRVDCLTDVNSTNNQGFWPRNLDVHEIYIKFLKSKKTKCFSPVASLYPINTGLFLPLLNLTKNKHQTYSNLNDMLLVYFQYEGYLRYRKGAFSQGKINFSCSDQPLPPCVICRVIILYLCLCVMVINKRASFL